MLGQFHGVVPFCEAKRTTNSPSHTRDATPTGSSAASWPPTSPDPAQPVPVIPFTEHPHDLFPAAFRQPIRLAPAAVPRPTMRLGAPACVGGDVRFDPVLEQRLDELLLEEPLVAAEALGPKAEPAPGPPQQVQTSVSLGEQALEDLHADTQKDAVAVLHHRVDRVSGIRPGARRPLRDVPAVRVGDRPVRAVAALLSAEVDGAVTGVLRSEERRVG